MTKARSCVVAAVRAYKASAAKFRPITVTDVQSDGRPLALPGDTHGSPHVRAAVAVVAARYS
eukprot:scaffold12997_cov141-Isochrysis_galbana.AAC.1